LADLQRTVYPHSGYRSAKGRAQNRVSSPAKDRRSANCATQPTVASIASITVWGPCLINGELKQRIGAFLNRCFHYGFSNQIFRPV